MKYFFDTEFLEDGKTIDLISIGIVAEDGRTFYAINEEANWDRILNDKWLRENVVPSLPIGLHYNAVNKRYSRIRRDDPAWDTREGIRDELLEFVDDRPEFWAYYADYDWVAFCQLFGRMIDLPKGFPMYCRDLKQWIDQLGISGHMALRQKQADEHNALADARWVRFAHKYASGYAKNRDTPCGY